VNIGIGAEKGSGKGDKSHFVGSGKGDKSHFVGSLGRSLFLSRSPSGTQRELQAELLGGALLPDLVSERAAASNRPAQGVQLAFRLHGVHQTNPIPRTRSGKGDKSNTVRHDSCCSYPRRLSASGSGYVATDTRPSRTTVIPDARRREIQD
jgi:hypothetical protein